MTPTLHLSVEITRRKHVHVLEDDAGGIIRTFRQAREAFDWLREENVQQVNLSLDGGTLEISIGEYLPW